MKKIPGSFQGILWSKKIGKLDLEKDKNYIVHQVLAYGSLEQIKQMSTVFPKREIIQIFVKSPRKNYSLPAFNFVKNYILGLKDKKISSRAYVKVLF